jgi:hypothetical protein
MTGANAVYHSESMPEGKSYQKKFEVTRDSVATVGSDTLIWSQHVNAA